MIYYKNIVYFVFIFFGFGLQAQKKFTIDKGEVSFTSNAKLELINAVSKKINGRIDPSTGQFAFLVKIQSFQGFNSKLQQEHFNESFMETDKYFDATFSGKIIESIDFSHDGVYDVRAKGNLVIHGKKQPRILHGRMQITKGTLQILSDFSVPLADHDIKIPQLITEKIATEILVKLNVSMVQN